MVFSSEIFLFLFLPATLLIYHVIDGRWKNMVLLLASLWFYAWGEPIHVLIMLASIVLNYTLGLLIGKAPNGKGHFGTRRFYLFVSCVLNIGILGFFKYSGFFVKNLNLLGLSLPVPEIALPIGISFYTFQIMSYVIDVYRDKVPVQRSILKLGLYISLFPQLIAGPIVRYSDVEKEISNRSFTWDDAFYGTKRFMFGFSKKILIADQVSKLADAAFSQSDIPMNFAWLGIVAYTIQIYFDFSGYSDMAIGLGRLFGFHFSENFDYPYISTSVREFWRRWHISLSSWFRDYVYIPMGGSRTSKPRLYFNLLTVFILTGFWHGAGWNFIIWGLWYGAFLILERILGDKFLRFPALARRVYTLMVIVIGWVFFRAENLDKAITYIQSMFSFRFKDLVLYNISKESIFFLFVGMILSVPLYQIIIQKTQSRLLTLCLDFSAFLFFFLSIAYMTGVGFSPFLYFRF